MYLILDELNIIHILNKRYIILIAWLKALGGNPRLFWLAMNIQGTELLQKFSGKINVGLSKDVSPGMKTKKSHGNLNLLDKKEGILRKKNRIYYTSTPNCVSYIIHYATTHCQPTAGLTSSYPYKLECYYLCLDWTYKPHGNIPNSIDVFTYFHES